MKSRAPLFGLTIQQPWANCIVYGSKRVENREWRPRRAVPFWLAIHAGQTDDRVNEEWVRTHFPQLGPTMFWERGAILGVCRVVEVVAYLDMPEEQQEQHNAWLSGPWCWILQDVVGLVEPIKCKGAQGLWLLPDDLLMEVRREYVRTNAIRSDGRVTETHRQVRSA